MMNFEKHIKTKNPIFRLLGNTSGSISTYFLIKEIRSEDKNKVKSAKLYAKLFSIFEKPQNRWATYYTGDFMPFKGNNNQSKP